MRKFLIYLCWFWFSGLFAQDPAYIHYGIEDGLPSNLVYWAEQDSLGFIWFGTDKGLARFDGTNFKVYGMKDGLPDPEVLALFVDSQKRMWISCFYHRPGYFYNGVFHTEKNDSLLRNFEMKSGICSFFEDRDHTVWMGGDSDKFCRWRKESLTCFDTPDRFGNNQDKNPALPTITIRNIRRYEDRLLGFCSKNILELSENGVTRLFQEISDDSGISQGGTFNHAFSGDYVLWLRNDNLLLLKYNGHSFSEIDQYLNRSGGAIFSDRSGRFWVSYSGEGLYLFDHRKKGLQDPKLFLKGKKVSHVFEDRSGNLWFSTLDEGIFLLLNNAASSFSTTSNPIFQTNNFTAVGALSGGRIAAGDDIRNLYFYDRGTWTLKQPYHPSKYDRVRQFLLLPDQPGLVITDKNIFTENGEAYLMKHWYKDQGAEELGSPKALCLDKEGWIWMGTSSYLMTWKDDPFNAKVVKLYRTTAIDEDEEGNIWIGGLDGIYSEKDNFKVRCGQQFPMLSGRIVTIKKAKGNAIWIVTPEFGLLYARVKRGVIESVEIINAKLSEPVENIQSLFVEPDGKVWMATNNGVYSYDEEGILRHFDEKDGIFNDVNAVYVRADTLWAATTAGLFRLVLGANRNEDFPTVFSNLEYIHDYRKVKKELIYSEDRNEEIIIPSGASLLEVSVAGLYYPGKGELNYEYVSEENLLPARWLTWGNFFNTLIKSLGQSKDTLIVNNPTRNFGVNLPPGRFCMKVTAVLPDGGRSCYPDERTLMVLPEWYQTIWFSLIMLGVIGFIGWRFYYERMILRQTQRMASDLQLQAIKAQINPHFVGNSINAIQQFFYPPDPVRASQYISTFTDLLRRTMKLSEIPFIAFKDELSYIKDYLEMIQLRFEDRFSYTIQGEQAIPPELPFPSMLLQPVLENATIHGLSPTGNSHLLVDFHEDDGRLVCVVLDNGVGIEVSKAKKKELGITRISKGIDLMKRKVEVLNRMHALDMKLDFVDLSNEGEQTHGTKVILSCSPEKLRKAYEEMKQEAAGTIRSQEDIH